MQLNVLPESIAFDKEQEKRRRVWNYAMALLVVVALVVIVSAIVWAH